MLGKKYILIFITLIHTCLFAENFNVSTPIDISFATGINSQIVSDSSGRYVFAIWVEGIEVKTATSNDFGLTWSNSILISSLGVLPQIDANSVGRYVFGIWQGATRIEIARSTNFGQTWSASPTDISQAAGAGSQIVADSSGMYVFAVWQDTGFAHRTTIQ